MAGRGRRKKNNNRAGKLCIGMIVIAFVAVMSVQIIRVYQKDQEYMQQEASLQKQLEEETAKGEKLSTCDLSKVYLFLVNEIEGEQITGCKDKDQILDAMAAKFPNARFVLTLGSDGAVYKKKKEKNC